MPSHLNFTPGLSFLSSAGAGCSCHVLSFLSPERMDHDFQVRTLHIPFLTKKNGQEGLRGEPNPGIDYC